MKNVEEVEVSYHFFLDISHARGKPIRQSLSADHKGNGTQTEIDTSCCVGNPTLLPNFMTSVVNQPQVRSFMFSSLMIGQIVHYLSLFYIFPYNFDQLNQLTR